MKTHRGKLIGVKKEEKRTVLEFESGGQYPLKIAAFQNQEELTNFVETGEHYEVQYTEMPIPGKKGHYRNIVMNGNEHAIKGITESQATPIQRESKKKDLETEFEAASKIMFDCYDRVNTMLYNGKGVKPEGIACVNSLYIEVCKRMRD